MRSTITRQRGAGSTPSNEAYLFSSLRKTGREPAFYPDLLHRLYHPPAIELLFLLILFYQINRRPFFTPIGRPQLSLVLLDGAHEVTEYSNQIYL